METPTLDERLIALADGTRRRLLVALTESDPRPVRPEASADPPVPLDEETVIELTHVHLPLLSTAGYVEWDRENAVVSSGPCFEAIEPLLTTLESHDEDLLVNGQPD